MPRQSDVPSERPIERGLDKQLIATRATGE